MALGYNFDPQTFVAYHNHIRFDVWDGRDVFHREKAVQVRLESNYSVFVSVETKGTLQTATLSFDELHAVIKEAINRKKNGQPIV